MEHALAEKTSKYERHYRICDYYRYVRNDSIHHDDKISVQLKAAYSVAKKIKEERLSAPNQLEKLQFDDQVLFARSARELIKAIYYESQYDWKAIVSAHKDDIKELIKSYSGNDSKERRIKNYLNCFYPIPAEGIANLMEMI